MLLCSTVVVVVVVLRGIDRRHSSGPLFQPSGRTLRRRLGPEGPFSPSVGQAAAVHVTAVMAASLS